jgi:flagellar basal body-associated protein FliL
MSSRNFFKNFIIFLKVLLILLIIILVTIAILLVLGILWAMWLGVKPCFESNTKVKQNSSNTKFK